MAAPIRCLLSGTSYLIASRGWFVVGAEKEFSPGVNMLSKNVQTDFHLQYNVAVNRGGHTLVERRPSGFLLMWIALIVLTSLTNCSESNESESPVTPCTSVPVVKGTPTKIVGGLEMRELNQSGEYLVFHAKSPSGNAVVQRVRKAGFDLVTLFECGSLHCSILYVTPTDVYVSDGNVSIVRIPINQSEPVYYHLPFYSDGADVYGDSVWGFRDDSDGYDEPGLLSYSMSGDNWETIVPTTQQKAQDVVVSSSESGVSWTQTRLVQGKYGVSEHRTELYHLPYDNLADGPIKVAGPFEGTDTLISDNDIFWHLQEDRPYGEPLNRWSKTTRVQSKIPVPTTQCEDLAMYGLTSVSFLYANDKYVFVAFDNNIVFAISLEKPEWISLDIAPEIVAQMLGRGVTSDDASVYWTDGSLIYSVAFSQFK